jgi:hypothetical protein
LIVPPQPLDTESQFLPAQAAAIVSGVQPHTLGVPGLPPLHVWPAEQPPPIVPHVNVPLPHPLSIVPQFLPAGHAVSGVQVAAQVPFEQT